MPSSTPCPRPVTGLPTGARILPSMPTTNLQPLLTVLQALNKNQEAAKVMQTKSVNINVKIINAAKKNMSETYVLRGVGSHNVANPTQLREQILRQFGSELVSSKADFAIGYQKGTSKVWIRTSSDIEDLWSFIYNGTNMTLWCHGLNPILSDSDDDDEVSKPKRKKKKSSFQAKTERLDELVHELRAKHGDHFNNIQYHLWAEMIDVGSYKYVNNAHKNGYTYNISKYFYLT